MGPFKRNLPNILSGLRIFLMIPFILAIKNTDHLLLIISAVSIVLTDYLDGKLARAWNVVSKLGKVLDPTADKICTALTALSQSQSLSSLEALTTSRNRSALRR